MSSRIHELVFRAMHRELAASGDTPAQFTASGGTTSSVVCAALTQADDYWNGAVIRWDSGANAGRWSNAGDFTAGTDTIALDDVLPNAVQSGDEFTMFRGGKFASSVEVPGLATAPLVNVTGFELVHAAGMNGEGTGTLTFSASTGRVSWRPPREDFGDTIDVASLALGERVAVTGGGTSDDQRSKFVLLERTAAALPVADVADDVSLDIVRGAVVAPITGAESSAGVVVYRPVALVNTSASAMQQLGIYCASPFPGALATTLQEAIGTGADELAGASFVAWGASGWVYNVTKGDARYYYDRSGTHAFIASPGAGVRGLTAVAWDVGDELVPMPWFDIGLGTAGVGDEFEDPATRSTAPSGVVFSCPLDMAEALEVAVAAPAAVICLWLRFEIPAGARPLEGGRSELRVHAQVTN